MRGTTGAPVTHARFSAADTAADARELRRRVRRGPRGPHTQLRTGHECGLIVRP